MFKWSSIWSNIWDSSWFISLLPTLLVDLYSCVYFAMRNNLPWSDFDSMQRFPHHLLPMDPQVCPPPLSSSQSMISSLDKSPISTYKPSHSRNGSTGSSKHAKQVTSLISTEFYCTVLCLVILKDNTVPYPLVSNNSFFDTNGLFVQLCTYVGRKKTPNVVN